MWRILAQNHEDRHIWWAVGRLPLPFVKQLFKAGEPCPKAENKQGLKFHLTLLNAADALVDIGDLVMLRNGLASGIDLGVSCGGAEIWKKLSTVFEKPTWLVIRER